jgi:hypothetical protein
MMSTTKTELRGEVRQLADRAFHLKLISGYGDGQDSDEFQIVYQGKPKHFSLERARLILNDLITSNSPTRWSLE